MLLLLLCCYLMVGLKGLAPGHALEKHGMEAVELNLER